MYEMGYRQTDANQKSAVIVIVIALSHLASQTIVLTIHYSSLDRSMDFDRRRHHPLIDFIASEGVYG
jgi:hypothetical protein